jgi:hypothetical protein
MPSASIGVHRWLISSSSSLHLSHLLTFRTLRTLRPLAAPPDDGLCLRPSADRLISGSYFLAVSCILSLLALEPGAWSLKPEACSLKPAPLDAPRCLSPQNQIRPLLRFSSNSLPLLPQPLTSAHLPQHAPRKCDRPVSLPISPTPYREAVLLRFGLQTSDFGLV